MLKLSALRSSSLALHAAGMFLGASTLVLAGGCMAPATDGDPGAVSESAALAGSTAAARAEEWVSAQLQYCQSANHERDYDDACTTYCERQDNPEWDPYRSDCSGLVSWAWELPAPGRVTSEFAPFETDITHVISASSLAPGDAVNNSDHIMLFVAWVTPGSRATFIEEPGCATSITHAHQFTSDVSISGSTITVDYWGKSFTAIRYDGIGSGGGGGTSGGGCVAGGLYCGGDKVTGSSGTLYRCNGTGAPTVVEKCANGCSVNAGADDSCKSGGSSSGSSSSGGSSSGGVSGGDCVDGGLYCGGDKVTGDSSTLYRCNGTSAPTVVEKCASGCSVNAGTDDSCKAASASGGNCVKGGLYCGGDKVSGSSGTLYLCNGPGAPTAIAHCSDGCEVRSGEDDACRGAGSCVVGGLYCGGDKVTGDPSALYRCTGGSAGTLVEHCASGCEVLSGKNDACK